MSDIMPCPCGEVPERIHIEPGSTAKWAFAYGDCCRWHVEFRTKYYELDSIECKQLALDAWNEAMRKP